MPFPPFPRVIRGTPQSSPPTITRHVGARSRKSTAPPFPVLLLLCSLSLSSSPLRSCFVPVPFIHDLVVAMANCGRRGCTSRPKKRTKYLSLKRVITKSEVDTPPQDDAPAPSSPSHPPPWLDDGQQQVRKEEDGPGQIQLLQVDPFAPHHEAASTLFAAVPAPSLSDILGASADSPSPSSASRWVFPAAEDDDLARRALRGRERWVYCRTGTTSSSSPTTTTATTTATTTTTTTTTTSSSPCSSAASTGASARSPPPPLLLKLDYDDILAAWADRGSLYVARAAPKNPDDAQLHLHLHDVLVEPTTPPVGACAPPGTAVSGSRAESVRRYREKRRNRLFAGRIRYEVRRVNAVKRPRFKGRFIKEKEGMEVHPR